MAGLHFPITADNRGFMQSIHEITAGVSEAARQIEANGGSIDKVISTIKNGLSMLGIGWGFKELVGKVKDTRDEFQKLEITFNTFLGSAEKTEKLMNEMLQTAAITPFDLAGVADGAKNLLAFGVAAEDVNKTLISLGDIAAGLSQPLGDIVYLYGTTIVKPKMDTQDLMQMMGRGIPIAKELAKQFGVAENKVRDLISAGKVSGEAVKKAFESMTAEGSMFGGLMEAQSKSIGGQIANIEDAVDSLFNSIGKSSEGLFSTVLNATGDSLEFLQDHIEELMIAINTAIAAFGVNKAYLMTLSAVTSSAYAQEAAALGMLLPQKEASANLDVQEAVEKGRLTQAIAAKVIAMRSELEAYLQSLTAAKSSAAAEVQLAAQKYKTALQQSIAAKAAIEAKRQELIASGEICGAYISENAVKEMGIAKTKAQEAAIASATAKKEYYAAVSKKKTASEALETATTNANTVSQTLNANSTTILTVAKERLITVTNKLWKVMQNNPMATVVVALGALYYAFTKVFNGEGKALEMSEKFGESTAKQISRLNTLRDILAGSERGSKTYKNALSELNEELKKNGIEQIKEGDNLDIINAKREKAIELIKSEAIERNRANELMANDEQYQSTLTEARKQLEKDLSVANTKDSVVGVVNVANDEIRSKATQIATHVSDVVIANITEIAGKSGKEYEEGIAKIYGEINAKMREIGLSEEAILTSWRKYGLTGNDFLKGYIASVKEAAEAHDTQKQSIEDVAEALRNNETKSLSYAEKVDYTRNKLILASGDVDTLYNSVKNLMDNYKDNTIGFHIKFNADQPPKWMEQFSDEKLKSLSTYFSSLGASLQPGQSVKIGDKVLTQQEVLQRGADYAQTLKNRSDKKKEKEGRWDEIDTIIKEKKKDAHKYAKGSKEALAIYAEIDKLEAEKKGLGDYDRDHKKKSGPTAEQLAAKEESAYGKLTDVIRKQGQERLRLEQDYEHERWQSRINLMADGEAKVLAQQKLDFDKEKLALQRRKKQEVEAEIQRQMALFDAEENVKAAANKKYAKKTFRDSDIKEEELDKIKERYKQLESDLTSSQRKAEQDRLDAANESMNAYLKEFGNYQQKRLAIEEEYARKIAEAPNRGERKIAMAQRDKAYADLDFNEWQENGGMALAFGDISRLSKETVTQLISDMEKYRSKIIATFDPDKIQKFEEALANLRSADIDLGLNFSGGNEILDSIRERLALQQQIADASANETALLEQKRQIESELAAINAQIFAGGIATAATDPNGEKADDATVVNEDMIAQADALRVKLDAVSRSLEKSSLNSQQLQSQLKALGKVKFSDIQKFSNNLLKAGRNAADLASIFSDDVADAIQTGADKVGVMFDAFTELSSNIEMLAKAGKDAVKETVDASKTIVEGASSGMKASAAATATSLSTMEKASAILAIIGAAIQLATMIASLFNSDKKHEKNIKKLQEQIDALQNSYDKLGRKIDEAYSTDASALIEQQDTLLRQQQALIRQQIAEEESKKKTDSEKIKQWKEQLEEINETLDENKKKAKEAIIGEDVKSAINEFASLYAEAWNDGTDAAQKSMAAVKNIISSALSEMLKKDIQPAATRFYDTLAEAMQDGVLTESELDNLDAIKREMDALAAQSQEQWEMIQSRYKDLDELKEELTDISFDSVRDNFKSLLSDMESTTADFTNSFSDMLRNALLEGLMDEKYDLMLREWYDEFAEAMNDRTLTDSERDALRQKYDAIVQQGIADRNMVNEIVGGGAYSQEATKGEWATMGQDTADELNGRFTALTELNAINNTLTAEGNMLSAQILETLRSLQISTISDEEKDGVLRDIRDMMFRSTGHLSDISDYTKHLITIREGIEKLNNIIDKRL